MDEKNKVSQTGIISSAQQLHRTYQSRSVESQVSSGKSATSQVSTALPVPRKEAMKDLSDSSTGSFHHGVHLNSSQTHPKKKGGFVITSVKDNVDGDESADDLDESHASYSDVSYSRTTDIDHDQESTASEDTLNLTLQDGSQQLGNSTQNHSVNLAHTSGPSHVVSDQVGKNDTPQASHHATTNIHANIQAADIKQGTASMSSVTNDYPQELPTDSTLESSVQTSSTIGISTDQSSPETTAGLASQQLSNAKESQQPTLPKPVTNTSKTNSISSSTTSLSVNSASAASNASTAKPASSSNAPLSKAGSRVYKVVKRETGQPVRRDAERWLCFDYGDGQTPNLGFVAQSASDSKLSFHDQSHIHSANQLALSMSTTSVPSSSSAYSLQHSDSTSSVHRDVHPHVTTTGHVSAVQHSASTSSINHDLEARKLLRSTKGIVNEILNYDERLSGESVSEQELLKNAMQSSGELSTNPEQDDESGCGSTSTGRIDNKIEAAMDLVKKHLMMAVRDEVDELKEKITELTKRNEALVDQISSIQPTYPMPAGGQPLPIQMKPASQNQQMPVYQQLGNMALSSAPSDHGGLPPLNQGPPAHQSLGQIHSLPINPMGFPSSNQPGPLQRGQSGPLPQNHAMPVSSNPVGGNPATISHPQQSLPAQQQVLQQQAIPQQPPQLSRPAGYQQNQAMFQSGMQPTLQQQQQQQQPLLAPNPQQSQTPMHFTNQQLQALLHLAFQQVSGQFAAPSGQMQQTYQHPQVVMQQLGLSGLSQQAPVQPAQFQSYQQQQLMPTMLQQQQQPGQLQSAVPPISQAQQGQFLPTSQSSAARAPAQTSQSATVLPRQPQQQQAPAANPTQSLPSMPSHNPVPNSLHGQQQFSAQPSSVPAPSGAAQTSNGTTPAEQKPPHS